jgi:hypothetical protein
VGVGAGLAVDSTVKLLPLAERKHREPHVMDFAIHLLADCPVRCFAEPNRAADFSTIGFQPLPQAVLESRRQLLVERPRF